MDSVTAELRRLRMSATPPLSVRGMADALGVPLSSYSRYENDRYFKKQFLPMEFVRKIAPILASRHVDPFDIMALAGLSADEAEPDVESLAAKAPPLQQIFMPVTLPSETALAEMFEALLLSISESLPRAELALQLAQLLPVGLAQLQFAPTDRRTVASTVRGASLPARANAGREPPQQSRT